MTGDVMTGPRPAVAETAVADPGLLITAKNQEVTYASDIAALVTDIGVFGNAAVAPQESACALYPPLEATADDATLLVGPPESINPASTAAAATAAAPSAAAQAPAEACAAAAVHQPPTAAPRKLSAVPDAATAAVPVVAHCEAAYSEEEESELTMVGQDSASKDSVIEGEQDKSWIEYKLERIAELGDEVGAVGMGGLKSGVQGGA